MTRRELTETERAFVALERRKAEVKQFFDELEAAAAALVARAAEVAAEAGARPVALFVGDREAPFLAGAFNERRRIYDEYRFEGLPASFEEYLAGLGAKRRNTVRNDLRRLEELGIRTSLVPLAENVALVAELVLAVKTRHGIADHAALIADRLELWLECREVEPVVFAAETSDRLLGVSVSWLWRDVLSTYEVGLPDLPGPERQLAYVELLFYAPLRLAFERGCREVTLGLGATTPKKARGAVERPVWALW
jgi:predicted N-acyltransferase